MHPCLTWLAAEESTVTKEAKGNFSRTLQQVLGKQTDMHQYVRQARTGLARTKTAGQRIPHDLTKRT